MQNKPGEAVCTCNAMVGTKRQADLWSFTIGQWRLIGVFRPVRDSVSKKGGCTALEEETSGLYLFLHTGRNYDCAQVKMLKAWEV